MQIGPIRSTSSQIEELAQVIGPANLLALCKALGGTKVYIPARIGHNNPIAVAIGMKAAALLADHYNGLQIDLPKAHARRARVLDLAKSGAMTIAEAALACDYTERRVYQLLAEEKASDDQLDLFNT